MFIIQIRLLPHVFSKTMKIKIYKKVLYQSFGWGRWSLISMKEHKLCVEKQEVRRNALGCAKSYEVSKVVLVPNQSSRHEDVWGSGGVTPRNLTFDTGWKLTVSFTSQPLYTQGKRICYPLYRRPVWTRWRRDESLPLPGTEFPLVQPVA
jgi:hypothetical protein